MKKSISSKSFISRGYLTVMVVMTLTAIGLLLQSCAASNGVGPDTATSTGITIPVIRVNL